MSVATIEGVVENGQIKLLSNFHLPERTKVYVVVPGAPLPLPHSYVGSPRLAHSKQAVDFLKTVTVEKLN
jgi:hypothetical protein